MQKEDLEKVLENLYEEIGKRQLVINGARSVIILKMKQRYIAMQNEYLERFNRFYEPIGKS